jgi:Transposase DDE domain
MELIINALKELSLFSRFLDPLEPLITQAENHRHCPQLPDDVFLRFGLLRALGDYKSGRHALQCIPLESEEDFPAIALSSWFEALASPRRLVFLKEVTQSCLQALSTAPHLPILPNHLAEFPELNGYDVWSGDGHWHAAAIHDGRDEEEKRWPSGHIFFLNQRNGLLQHLVACDHLSRKKEHDIHAIKGTGAAALKFQRSAGQKTLIVYDRASIDFTFWGKAKQAHGIYLITRLKNNMAPVICGQRPIAKNLPINQKVISDQLVGFGQVMWRLITVVHVSDPTKTIEIITNNLELEPGLIAELYRRRWDIERVFDTLKNKCNEGRSWASSPEAKTANALFVTLAYNLAERLHNQIEKEEQLVDHGENKRSASKSRKDTKDKKDTKEATTNEDQPPKSADQTQPTQPKNTSARPMRRRTTLGVKFLRWLQSCMFSKRSWQVLLDRLRKLWAKL